MNHYPKIISLPHTPARNKILLTGRPPMPEKYVAMVADAARTGWGEKAYDYIQQFEQEFAQYVGAKHALATSSCTGALHLALLALGITEGDEVIVPEITWVASADTVKYCGAEPIMADISEDTWTIDPDSIIEKITPKTKAIVIVDNYGNVCDMAAIREIARKHNLYILEDAATGLGASYNGTKAGILGDIGTFSFEGSKIITTGQGGMLVTNNTSFYETAKKFGNHNMNTNEPYIFDGVGYKYKMPNLVAPLGLAQLRDIDSLVAKKRQIFDWYNNQLRHIEGIQLNVEKPGTRNAFWLTSIVLNKNFGLRRDAIISEMHSKNIMIRPMHYPISSMQGYIPQNNPTARKVSANGINLPSGFDMTEDSVSYVCEKLLEVIQRK
ncbi:MAG TPA: hypothetical protein DF296_09610 [Candidatus Margulisbacteria bacterium]|nr:MAG: hypothetical protein A2X42_05160 [Candidatus Margulisbacteria bacterium GWF2_38_17]OGI05627.1 MAG: hypothetical protein A2X41_06060 [Candidatus Margulisbacteria bacterium GWE2_39_32]HCT85443.1 hypothetical protein [Candidatus Margulisiibacteriota bacterium]